MVLKFVAQKFISFEVCVMKGEVETILLPILVALIFGTLLIIISILIGDRRNSISKIDDLLFLILILAYLLLALFAGINYERSNV